MLRIVRHASIALVGFDQYGDIDIIDQTCSTIFDQACCQRLRDALHQIGLILIVCLYLIFGGFFFSSIESRHYMAQDHQRQAVFRDFYGTMRQVTDDLFNDQLNENFEEAYLQWRWNSCNRSIYIDLNPNRTLIFERHIDRALIDLVEQLTDGDLVSEKYAYKWTFSTSMLYAATLVTTIGYGNIAPKTVLGKISTVIYGLMGILLAVSWLKSAGGALAVSVTSGYHYFERFWNPYYRRSRNEIYLSEKAPVWVPISLLLLYLIAGSVLFAIWEGWSYIDGAYFSFITFTTIGFGDLVPGEGTLDYRNGRSLLCAMYLLFGVMLTAMCLASIQEDINRMKSYLLQRLGFDQISLTNSNQI